MNRNFVKLNDDLSDLVNVQNGCQYTDIEDLKISNLSISKYMLNVLHLNIRSLHKNIDLLVLLLSDLRDKGIIVHVIGICETFLNDKNSSLIDIENYTAIHCTHQSKLGGGVSIYLHDNIKFVQQINTPFNEAFESCSMHITFKRRNIFVCEFYCPPNSDDKLFIVSMEKVIKASSKFKTIFLCGDQNYYLKNLGNHKAMQDFVNYICERKFIPTILVPTRVTHTTNTIIDNIYVNNDTLNKHYSYVITDGMSDHYPCLLLYDMFDTYKYKSEVFMEKRKLNDTAVTNIQRDLLFHDWSCLDAMSVDESYSYLITVITGVMDTYAPIKQIKIRACDKFREPWMSVRIKKSTLKARKLCNRTRKSGKHEDFARYKHYRNTLNRIKLHERRVHYDDLFKRISKNSALLWNVINNLVRKTSNKCDIVSLECNGKSYNNQQDVCDVFNEHFASAGKRIKNMIPSTSKDPIDYVKLVSDRLIFSPVSEQYICKIVANLKPKRSCGYDQISNVLLKSLINVIKLPICKILNKSILMGEFPKLMKVAKVIPLYKNGSKLLPDNYTPILLLPVISKILEKVIFDQLVVYLNTNSVQYPKQFGFRRNHSTSDGIMNLVSDVLKSFKEKFMLVSVFIDLRKAFNTVSHSVILNKLIKLGIGGTELEWFTSYITGQKQFVAMNNGSVSKPSDITVGVQQGSLLGVLLFQLIMIYRDV